MSIATILSAEATTSAEEHANEPPRGAVSEAVRPAESGLPVRIREVLRGDGQRDAWAGVVCPRSGTTKAFDQCAACERFQGLSFDRCGTASVRCDHGVAGEGAERATGESEAGVRQAASSSSATAAAAGRFVCVSEDAPAESVMELLVPGRENAAVVVDAAGKPIGMVTRADFLRRALDDGETEETAVLSAKERRRVLEEAGLENDAPVRVHTPLVASDVMTPLALSLPDGASIAQAAALMAYERVHQVPVVADTGEIVAVVTSLDVLRWLGRHAGYLMP